MKVLEYIIRALDKTGEGTKSAQDKSKSLASSIMSNLANIKAGWDMMTAAVGSAAEKLWETVKEAFKFETLTLQFSILMGSMEKAKDRMKELADFAANTPFNLEEVVVASRQLHVFSDGALGASASLELVGDAAAATGQRIQEVSFWVGRAYSMIKGGQPFGEAAMRLQEMGLITPEVRDKMESLQASGEKNIDVWHVLSERLSTFRGGMKQLALTGDGLISTLEDTYTAAKRTFGDEFKETAKKAISGLIEWIDKLTNNGTITKWAKQTLDLLYEVAAAAKAVSGGGADSAKAWGAIKDVFVGALELGAQRATSLLEASAPRIGALIGSAAKAVMTLFKQEDFKTAAKEIGLGDKVGFWGGAFGEDNRLTKEENIAVQQRMAENQRKSDLEKAGFSGAQAPTGSAQERLDRGLKTLGEMGNSLKDKVENAPNTSASDKAAEDTKKASAAAQAANVAAANDRRIEEEMARSQAAVDARKKTLADTKAALEASKASEDPAKDRLARAKDAAQKAWGWYRDPEEFQKQLQEERDNSKAEEEFKKDFERLKERQKEKGADWRTAELSDGYEAVRRVALAREEQTNAAKSMAEIAENTAGLKDMLEKLLTSK